MVQQKEVKRVIYHTECTSYEEKKIKGTNSYQDFVNLVENMKNQFLTENEADVIIHQYTELIEKEHGHYLNCYLFLRRHFHKNNITIVPELTRKQFYEDAQNLAKKSKFYLEFEQMIRNSRGQRITPKQCDAIVKKYADLIVNDVFKNKEKDPSAAHSWLKGLILQGGIYVIEDITETGKKTAPTLGNGWFIYIVAMIFFSIFNQRIGFWIITTIIFFVWRAGQIEKYN